MSDIRQFGLIGVGPNIQLGKSGNRIDSTSGVITFYASDNSTLSVIRAAQPVGVSDVATRGWVEQLLEGLDPKEAVKCATTVNITLSGLQTIDGYSVQDTDRVLVKNQTTQSQNGIYIAGTGAWVRSSDANSGAELEAAYTFVENGTQNGNTGWVQVTSPPITIGTTNIVFSQFSGAGTYTAGSGLTLTGGQFSVNVTNSTIRIISNNIAVNSSSTAGQVLVSGGTVGIEATWGALDLANANALTNTLPVGKGGTGTTTLTSKGILYGNGTSAVQITAAGSQYQVLRVPLADGIPAFGSINLASSAAVTGILPIANGGTGTNITAVNGGIVYSTASALDVIAAGTSGQILTSNGAAAPSWSSLYTGVSGAANAGTGTGVYSTITAGVLQLRNIKANSTKVAVALSTNDITVDVTEANLTLNNIGGTLGVTKGGTGLSSVASGNIIYTSAANTFSATAITAFGISLIATADAAAARTTLGLTIGTNVQAYDATLGSLAAYNTNGFLVQTAADTFAGRTISAGTGSKLGISVVNGDGISGNPVIGLDITNLTAGTPLSSQEVAVYNSGTTSNVKLTLADVVSLISAADPLSRYATVAFAASTNIGSALPTNARIKTVTVEVTTAYTSGATMAINAASGLTSLAVGADIDLQTVGTYSVDLSGRQISSGQISAVISGSPVAGASFVMVEYKIGA